MTYPSINNNGVVAFGTFIFDPINNRPECVVLKNDGTGTTVLANLTDAGFTFGVIQWVVINDAGTVGMYFWDDSSSFPRHRLLRINTDGSITTLLTADTGGSLPYLEFTLPISMNDLGQIAVLAKNLDNTQSILRVDSGGVTEIARGGSTFNSLNTPSINDSGVVAFKAGVATETIVTGNGGPLTEQGRPTGCHGRSHLPAVINNSGRVLSDCGGPPIYTTQAGVATILIAGTEDPIFSRLTERDWIDMNNLGVPVFGAKAASLDSFGIFTGGDPVANRVIGSGDAVLGGTVTEVRLGMHSISDSSQIAFLLQVEAFDGSTISHVVRATPPRASQTIFFDPLPDRVLGDPPFVVNATASSDLPVGFNVTGSCTLAAKTVTMTSIGNCTITASQPGNANYEPAPQVSRTFAIRQSIKFHESFEANPGLDEVYTDTFQHPGNTLNPDFNTLLIGSPAGWGAQCAHIVIGSSWGGAGWRQHLTRESTTGYNVDISFLLSSTSMLDGTGITIIAAKPQGNPDGSIFAFRLFLYRTGPDVFLLFNAGQEDQHWYRFPASGSISAGVMYNHHIQYDIKSQRFGWTVNGMVVASAAMPSSWVQNIATKYIGSSASSTGRNTAYLIDRVIWSEIDP
jgi:hypothetical protein